MRAGDTVKHRPSGETWLVACVTDDGAFFACGWPETRAQQSDADVIEEASDEECLDVLRRFTAMRDTSSRASWARENLRAITLREAAQVLAGDKHDQEGNHV